MSRDSKDVEIHPVPRLLEQFEILLNALKDMALIEDGFDEFELIQLHEMTEKGIALYDRFCDRELVNAFIQNDAAEDPEIQASMERVRQRLITDLFDSDGNTELQDAALRAMPTSGKAN